MRIEVDEIARGKSRAQCGKACPRIAFSEVCAAFPWRHQIRHEAVPSRADDLAEHDVNAVECDKHPDCVFPENERHRRNARPHESLQKHERQDHGFPVPRNAENFCARKLDQCAQKDRQCRKDSDFKRVCVKRQRKRDYERLAETDHYGKSHSVDYGVPE